MITIENISKEYYIDGNSIRAVDDVSLEIQAGEIFGVIGYSGAGKSTLVNLLNRLEEPTSGKITVANREITKLKAQELRKARREIGMIFQHFNLLWSRTTEDNIAFPLEIAGVPKAERDQRVQELIQLVGLEGREKAYPSQLSGGQKQRVGIARALANRPKVLLSDEATSALDPETTENILDLLVDINKKLGLTIIIITHEMQVIQKICHRVAVMEKGKIVEEGKVIDVFSRPKQTVTKRFVQQVMQENDHLTIDNVLKYADKAAGEILQLTFSGTSTNQPFITEIAHKYRVAISILQGKVIQTENGPVGNLIVQIVGSEAEVETIIREIKNANVAVEIVQ